MQTSSGSLSGSSTEKNQDALTLVTCVQCVSHGVKYLYAMMLPRSINSTADSSLTAGISPPPAPPPTSATLPPPAPAISSPTEHGINLHFGKLG